MAARTLAHGHLGHAHSAHAHLARGHRDRAENKARDWAEIQERMLVPLYETVYERLETGPGTRLLGLDCGSGLALLMAAARGAAVTGCDADDRRLGLARERLLPEPQWGTPPPGRSRARLLNGGPEQADDRPGFRPFTMVTALDPATPHQDLAPALSAAARLAERGSPVVLAGWGPPERCATGRVLRVAARLAEPRDDAALTRLSGRDDLEDVARTAGLRTDGSGRVACPFGYPDMDSAIRGLVSTGLFDAAVTATDQVQVEKELAEALHPYRRADGSVRMDNVFRYVIARV
jgi:SAM-dependent methyltransferase